MTIRTSKIIYNFNIEQIENDFHFLRFERCHNGKWYGAYQLDKLLGDEYQAEAVLYKYGKYAYAMFKKSLDIYEILKHIRTKGDFENDIVQKVVPRVSYVNETKDCICGLWLGQILINSLGSSKSKYRQFHYSNLTGALIKTPVVRGDTIDAIRFSLDKGDILNIRVERYRKLISIADKYKYAKKPKYYIHNGTSSFSRYLGDNKNLDLKKAYVKAEIEGTKATKTFIDFSSLRRFEKSRIYMFQEFKNLVIQHLSKYLTVEFNHLKTLDTYRLTNTIIKKPKHFNEKLIGKNIRIVDKVDSVESKRFIMAIKETLKEHYISDKALITEGKREKSDAFNIVIIHDQEYYKKNNLDDKYKASNAKYICQHLVIKNYYDIAPKDIKPIVKTMLKELLIKEDIISKKVTLFNWQLLDSKKRWVFGTIDEAKRLSYFMTIKPNGEFDVECVDGNNFFEVSEYQSYLDIIKQTKDSIKSYAKFEGIVVSEDGDINLIFNTNEISLPAIEEIKRLLIEVEKDLPENIRYYSDLVKIIKECFGANIDYYSYRVSNLLNNINTLSDKSLDKYELRQLIKKYLSSNSNDARKLRQHLLENYYVRLNFPKDNKSLQALFKSSLDINFYTQSESEAYYFVGCSKEMINKKIDRATRIRKVIAVSNSKLIFSQILQTMNVDFVRTGQSTVLPFPFKYLREFIGMQK